MHMAVRQEKAQAAYGCEEFGRLESVLVHTPGEELLCLNESNYRQWLFDRVPDIDRFVAEHARWCHLLEENGVEVNQLADHVKVNSELLRELPNVMYLHDTAVVTSRGAILSRMLWPARRREEVVVGEALADLGIPTWIDFPRPDDGFEGCLLLSPETVLVAYTERHVAGSIRRFIPQALEAFDEVVFVDIPKGRRYMHPDTIFNRVSHDLALAYLPAFEETVLYRDGTAREVDFADFMAARGVELIGVSDSEQQRLACTFVPLEPGVIFHYDTALDLDTARKLARRGVEIILLHPEALTAGGGSLRCLTLRLRRNPEACARPAREQAGHRG
jgi:arginine deiminase